MASSVTAQHLQLVIDRLSDGLVLFDREGRAIYLNSEAARILGKEPGDLIGKGLNDILPEVVGRTREGLRDRLIAGEEVLLLRTFFARGRWFEVLGRPLEPGFLVHFRDITERLQADSARHQSEERFRTLVNGVKDYALIMLDPKGQIASWNVGAERLSGYPAGEVVGKHLSFLFPPHLAERGAARRRLEEAIEQGSVTAETWVCRKNGSRFLTRATYTPLLDDLDYPSGFALVAQDITEQRAMEESLQTNEERLRLAVAAGRVGTWEENLDEGRFIADQNFLAICGLPPHDQPSFAEFHSLVHPEDRDYFKRTRSVVLEAASGYEFEIEYRLTRRADGKTRWVECHGRVLDSDQDHWRRRIVGVLRDTTKRHDIDEFRKLSASIIAHDLRSPLSAIKLTSQMLTAREALPDRVVQKLRTIVGRADRMSHMIEQLLLYAQAQFGRGLPLERRETDLREVCDQAIAEAKAAHPDSKIDFNIEGDCRGIWDRDTLIEVASNLLGNAVKHGQPGQPIEVAAKDEGDQVSLRVHNVGPPIPRERLEVIFEPFRRADEHTKSGDSFGLGLYIVKEIIAAHGGTIDVRSLDPAGTTFTIRLPRGEATEDALTA